MEYATSEMVPFSPFDAAASPPVVKSLAPDESSHNASRSGEDGDQGQQGAGNEAHVNLPMWIKNTMFGKP